MVRGELPLEVRDLEDELEGLRARLERMEDDNDQVNQRILAYQMQIKDSQALIEKYTEQQNNVRNNREFESLAKEIEYQTLEIELCEKRIRECQAQTEQKAEGLEGTRERFNQRKPTSTPRRQSWKPSSPRPKPRRSSSKRTATRWPRASTTAS